VCSTGSRLANKRSSQRSGAVEVLNTLLVGERKGRITAEQTNAFLDTLKILSPALDYATLD